MSTENVEKFFFQDVENDSALQASLKAASDSGSFAQQAVQLGQEKGYSFTAEEVEAVMTAIETYSDEEELSERELESVAGGGFSQGFGCVGFRGITKGMICDWIRRR
ncbi:MAG: Nif11-like leader peptide family natural product precursor [Coleofasciculus sp. S288]|nr:Nif11-like leader peptide family natural product precursor [Coleofasciculus sp. S288]